MAKKHAPRGPIKARIEVFREDDGRDVTQYESCHAAFNGPEAHDAALALALLSTLLATSRDDA